MIFLGDISHPFINQPDWTEMTEIAKGQAVVANLEGPLNDDLYNLESSVLFNHPSIIESLVNLNTRVVSLANNHISDIKDGILATRRGLESRGILSVGAGTSFDEAATAVYMKEYGKEYIFLAFGWSTIQCDDAGATKAGTNPLSPRHVLDSVQKAKLQHPNAYIVLLLHWNYELERYPQPGHRQLAFAAIDLGAAAVIGHHPHCVGGIEIYKDALVAYSLGNWWLPQNVFFNGTLRYPSHAKKQLALEWNPGEQTKLHWFDYDDQAHSLAFQGSENFESSEEIARLTPFSGLSHAEYKKWFRRNRVKKKLLPIYRDYNHATQNWFFDRFVGFRHSLLIALKGILVSLRAK